MKKVSRIRAWSIFICETVYQTIEKSMFLGKQRPSSCIEISMAVELIGGLSLRSESTLRHLIIFEVWYCPIIDVTLSPAVVIFLRLTCWSGNEPYWRIILICCAIRFGGCGDCIRWSVITDPWSGSWCARNSLWACAGIRRCQYQCTAKCYRGLIEPIRSKALNICDTLQLTTEPLADFQR